MNLIDRVLPGGASGSFLVTDFDNGSSFFNSLNQPTAPTIHYDDGFPGLQNALIPDSTSLSLAAFPTTPSAADLFDGLPDTFLEGTTAAGDSGGPLYVLNPLTGEWEVAGITSWGTNPLLEDGLDRQNSIYGDVAFYTDVAQHSDWIQSTTQIPEVSSSLLTLLGMIAFAARIRNRPFPAATRQATSPDQPTD
ncbi:trypsin-like serine protease [Haloferula sp. A504]|uniref:trypsin-like serine protease n=1 Tax=Haloferula sp. A504 TaxID=3373601 RepID=UPI0031C7A626|nr:trypsin-like serine protease [Verrucomicrobiaceae bacterium E54]